MLRDRPFYGALLGIVFTLAGLAAVYIGLFYFGQGASLTYFLSVLSGGGDGAVRVLSLALLANIVPITIVRNRRYNEAARGLFVVIMLLAMYLLWEKFVH